MNSKQATILFEVILFLCLFVFFLFLAKYFHDYKIFQMWKAKAKGDIFEFDRIRRDQMKRETENATSIFDDLKSKKIPIVSKYYYLVAMSGIHDKFPGLSEALLATIILMIAIAVFVIMMKLTSLLPSIAAEVLYVIVCWFTLDRLAYRRRMNVLEQLLQFTNSCASASRQYASIIDIIGVIYDQFQGPFREALEECYVVAKSKFDENLAFSILKSKFNSPQLSFVIDNMVMCSASTGDYYTVATDLSKTLSIFTTSHERKMATLRNAKVNIMVMFAAAIVIVWSLLRFFGGGFQLLITNPIGLSLIIAMIGVLFFGLSKKVD